MSSAVKESCEALVGDVQPKAKPPKFWKVVYFHENSVLTDCSVAAISKIFNISWEKADLSVSEAILFGNKTLLVTTAEVAETKEKQANQRLDGCRLFNLYLEGVYFKCMLNS